MPLTDKQLAEAAYAEAVSVTAAFHIQLHRRKYGTHSDPDEKARRIEEAEAQLQAAERAEYAAWQQLEYLLKMAIKQPWTASV